MKKYTLVFILISFLSSSLLAQDGRSYRIEAEVEGLEDSTVYMAYYYGKGQFYRDTAKFNHKGVAVFSNENDTLEYGMYALITKSTKLFDFVVDNQKIHFETDTGNFVQNMKVKGSMENIMLFEYLQFLQDRQSKATQLRNQLSNATSETEKQELQAKIKEMDNEVREYLTEYHKRYAGSLPSNFIKALDYPEVPEPPKNENGSIDSTFRFRYFKSHFFDNFDFSDDRLVRTSVFHEKLVYYLDKLTQPDADSIIVSVDYILGKTKQSPDLFRYALSYMTSRYERSEKMGMDAVFVHLGKNYLLKGAADEWFSKKQKEKLEERVVALEPLLIGKKAPNIVVKDTAMKEFIQLYDVEAKYTVVYIWSPECGHCKKATPKLKKVYDKYKDQGLEVFAVGNEFENLQWKIFINDHNLNWINGSDGEDYTSNFRTLYDVYSTPQTYLLDENKKILAKKISIESLENILKYYLEKDKKEEANAKE